MAMRGFFQSSRQCLRLATTQVLSAVLRLVQRAPPLRPTAPLSAAKVMMAEQVKRSKG
jgi:hypothetical protein